uniref:Uncharacterized protein n=1 Tax=Arundo donax TaxID=35708 RepID=A0A0A9G7V8_ARUDO
MGGTLEPPCVTLEDKLHAQLQSLQRGPPWMMNRFRPRIAGLAIQRPKMEQICPSIHTHQE